MKPRFNPWTGTFDLVDTGGGGGGTVTSVAGGTGITNTPEPIVGAGTVDLDIQSLTTLVGPAAAGDWLALVDIDAGGSQVANQRKVALTDLADAIEALLGGPFQPLDAGLTALASLGAGIAVSDGADGWTPRSIAVTDTASVDLTVTNASGVAGNPTLSATVLAAGVDHGGLAGLADDDHTQYLLLAGRAGGQTANGGTGAGDNLTARSTSHPTKGLLIWDDAQDWWPSFPDPGAADFFVARFAPTASVNVGGTPTKSVFLFDPTLATGASTQVEGMWTIVDVAGTFDAQAFPDLNTFSALRIRTEFNADTNVAALPGPWARRLMEDASVTRATLGSSGTTDPIATHYGLNMVPSFSADGASAFLALGGGIRCTRFQPSISALNGGYVVGGIEVGVPQEILAHEVAAPLISTSGGGTFEPFSTFIGFTVANIPTTVADVAVSFRSAGTSNQMRHGGPGVFGANAAPTNASVALEVQSTIRCLLNARMTTAQQVTMTGVAVADGMQFYDSTLTKMQFRENGAWVGFQPLDADLTAIAAIGVSEGSLIIGSNAPAWVELVIGATDKYLRSNGTTAAWADVTELGLVDTYNGITTVSVGMPSIVAQATATGQTGNIGSTPIYTAPSDGFYCMAAEIIVTTVAGVSSTMPSVTFAFTNGDNATLQTPTVIATSGGNTLTTRGQAVHVFYANSGSAIAYATAGYASNPATTMQYSLRIRLEAL